MDRGSLLQDPIAETGWLNSTKGWVEGTGDVGKGEFHGKVYAMK